MGIWMSMVQSLLVKKHVFPEMLSFHSPAQHEIWLTAILLHCRLQSNSHSHF